MLLAREKKIVTLLMEHKDKLTTTQIATSLKVSSRTIKTDIKRLMKNWKNIPVELTVSRGWDSG